ncbi:MAG: DUF1566 domain-containing protein [Betaproteobacteria bacterium]|nr:DUF1566 domain-containing protein [Betaproteobacteria bacterium]
MTTTNSWYNLADACAMRAIGGRRGWRLPSVHELASLVDPAATNPALPSGHPFLNVQSGIYWSAAIRVNSAPWIVNFLGCRELRKRHRRPGTTRGASAAGRITRDY